jgi:ubiquinone/menaquinone biosynthesis C-methylase UbiE
MSLKATDVAWETWGQKDPYFGVITDPRFRKENLTPEAKKAFFDSGRGHTDAVFAVIRTFVAPAFSPKRVVDFGCGVGRLVIPFASVASEVVGVDVSEAMLAEASKNCVEAGITNVRFVRSDDELGQLDGQFDLIHSCLVFQHIPVARGRVLLRTLLSHLAPGGIGVVDFTYGKSYFADSFGVPPVIEQKVAPPQSAYGKAIDSIKTFGASKTEPEAEEEPGDPEMQMNAYNLSEIFFLLKEIGVINLRAEFMDHGGEQAVLLFFQKPASAPT